MLTRELLQLYRTQSGIGHKVRKAKKRLHVALQRLFPISADERVDEVKSLTEKYHKYKWEYVKHLVFNPDEENLSKNI